MQIAANPGLYDIESLRLWIDAGCTLLTPNFRLARRIKSEWNAAQAARGQQAWEPLPVVPLELYLQQQWEDALARELLPACFPLGGGQTLELWRQVIEQDQIDSGQPVLLQLAAAARQAAQARDTLLLQQVDLTADSLRQEFGFDPDAASFWRWNQRFEQRLRSDNLGTDSDCLVQLARCAGSLPQRSLLLLEFDEIAPLPRAILALISDHLSEFSADSSAAVEVHSYADPRGELQAAARWARRSNRETPAASIGIVLSDMAQQRVPMEYLLRREFGCLGANYGSLPVNFSTGISLEAAPLVRDALAVLALGEPRVAINDVVTLLHSRFLQLADAGTPLANKFIRELYDRGREQLASGDLRYAASNVSLGESRGLLFGEHLMSTSGMRELRRPAQPAVWAERFSAVLKLWGWPGGAGLDSLEFQQFELWQRTLEQLGSYGIVCGQLDYHSALDLLRGCCREQISQPQTADSRVQVVGPLEARGLSFDHLWVCGMQANRWPTPANANPFIPRSLQRRLDLPHASAEREWRFAEHLFTQYRHSCAALYASFARHNQGIPALSSPLLEEFETIEEPGEALLDPQWRRVERIWEQLDDHQAPPLGEREPARTHGGSGLLEDQSQCPFRAFAQRRLLVQPLGAFGAALSPAERGSLLHDALYALWGTLGDQRSLLALSAVAVESLVEQAVDSALRAIDAGTRRSLGPGYWKLEGQHLSSLLREWLEIERQRSEFVVAQREQAIELQLDQLQIRLRVDRIDQLPDGSRVIIDYKSGRSSVQDWMGSRPARPQLLLYGMAVDTPPAALAFAQLRARDCKLAGVGSHGVGPGIVTDLSKLNTEGPPSEDWAQLNAQWRATLERLAAEFVAGDAAVDPLSPNSCTWCGLQPLCRIEQQPIAINAEGDLE